MEAKIISLGSEKRGFFACIASQRNRKNKKRNKKCEEKGCKKNYLEAKEKCDAKLGGVFLFKRKQCFLSFRFKTKITQV
jgi:hypothetical protein